MEAKSRQRFCKMYKATEPPIPRKAIEPTLCIQQTVTQAFPLLTAKNLLYLRIFVAIKLYKKYIQYKIYFSISLNLGGSSHTKLSPMK
jgi:hypothetical protein